MRCPNCAKSLIEEGDMSVCPDGCYEEPIEEGVTKEVHPSGEATGQVQTREVPRPITEAKKPPHKISAEPPQGELFRR